MSFSVSMPGGKTRSTEAATLENVPWYCSDELAKDLEDQKHLRYGKLAVAIALGDAIQNQDCW
jgi:hypothetical protein